MGKELVRACVLCLLCATHAHCSNTHTQNNTQHIITNLTHLNDGGGPRPHINNNYQDLERRKRGGDDDFIKIIFQQFGDGETISKQGFEKLLESLTFQSMSLHTDHEHTHSNGNSTRSSNRQCVKVESVIGNSESVSMEGYRELCPKLVHHVMTDCNGRSERNRTELDGSSESEDTLTAVWVYASASVLMISLCGVLAVGVIPLMHHSFYQSLLQFLVALAVGTLCGDALLHLLPHAMMSHRHHGEGVGSESEEEEHGEKLMKGLVAALAVVFFYLLEKCLAIIADYRKRSQRKHHLNTRKVRVMREEGSTEVVGSRVGEKLCKHKYSSYPYCYGEITTSPDGGAREGQVESGDGKMINCDENPEKNSIIHNHKLDENDVAKEDVPCYEKQLLENFREPPTDYTTVILREHESRHHGHAHTHGHVHSAPKSMSSVAWMVILGDGVHNFTDGLAIGAAFAANIGGGVSTAVAVFCHELPHEIGDFAVLLKAGMPAKQAVFYNVLSSVLCLFGMVLGVMLGHSEQMTQWVFSAAAGMFLYIALVDMIPELTSSHSTEGGGLMEGALQLTGLLSGIFVMLLIALYEHDLKDAFKASF